MKRLLTLTFIMTSAVTLNAQQFKHERKPLTSFEAYRQHILAKAQPHNTVQKTTAMQQRVVAEAGYNVNGTALAKSDTTYFKYSYGRGSTFDYDELYHNYYFPGKGDPGIDPFAFGDIDVKADTARYFTVDTAMHLMEEMYCSYTSANKVWDYVYRNTDNGQKDRVVNAYDAQGRLTLMTGFSWNSSTQQWDSSSRRVIDYNAQNEVVSDTLFSYSMAEWLPMQVLLYTYNASGKLSTATFRMDPTLAGTFMDVYVSNLDYYPNNTLKTITIDANFGSGLMPYERDSFAYDPANSYNTYHEIWSYNTSNNDWLKYAFISRNVNAMGIPDTTQFYSYDQIGDSFVLNGFVATAYNSFKNPTVMQSYSLNGTTFDNDYRYFFYYEDFDPTAVNNVSTAPEDMTVYPNPVKNIVHINWKADGKRVHINMVNASGQLVYSESVNRMKETTQVSVSALPAGMYWLTVTDEHGAIIYRTGLLKQ